MAVQMMSLPHMALDFDVLERLSKAAASGELDKDGESVLYEQQQPETHHRLH